MTDVNVLGPMKSMHIFHFSNFHVFDNLGNDFDWCGKRRGTSGEYVKPT